MRLKKEISILLVITTVVVLARTVIINPIKNENIELKQKIENKSNSETIENSTNNEKTIVYTPKLNEELELFNSISNLGMKCDIEAIKSDSEIKYQIKLDGGEQSLKKVIDNIEKSKQKINLESIKYEKNSEVGEYILTISII